MTLNPALARDITQESGERQVGEAVDAFRKLVKAELTVEEAQRDLDKKVQALPVPQGDKSFLGKYAKLADEIEQAVENAKLTADEQHYSESTRKAALRAAANHSGRSR